MMNSCVLIRTKIKLIEEESDEDLDEEYDSETKADVYLNEVTQDQVFENNDNNENYTFSTAKIKYESKFQVKEFQNSI
jgi:hypothetical protein